MNTEDIKQSVHIAGELRKSFASNQKSVIAELSSQLDSALKSEQILLAQNLQSALSVLKVLVLDQAPELTTAISDQVLQRVVVVATRLYEHIGAVLASAQVVLQQSDITYCENEQEIRKRSLTDEILPKMAGQEPKPTVIHKTITFEKEVVPEEQTMEIAVKSTVLKAELQQNDDAKETAVVSFEQVACIDNADNTTTVEMKQTRDEIVPAESVAVS